MFAASVERFASSFVICESRGLRLHSHSASGAPAARSCSTTCMTLSSISRKMISSETDILSSAGAAVDVVDDVHHLEHDARPLLVRAVARGDEEQIARGQVGGDLVGDRHRERARQVVDRVGADVLEPRHLVVRLGVELVEPQEPVDLGVVGEATAGASR